MTINIEELAKQAGMRKSHHPNAFVSEYADCVFGEHIEAFAHLIIEQCAAHFDDSDTMIYRSEVAAAIRKLLGGK